MAVRGMPKTIPELLSKAGKLHRQGLLAEATDLYRHILERDPGNVNALQLYGVLALQAGRVKEAIDHIERAVGIDASRASMHFNLGNAYLQANQVDNAINAYRRALGIDNGLVPAWCGLGSALTRAGEYDDAVAAAGRALQLEPDSIAALACIAAAWQNAGEVQRALDSYEQALGIMPDNPELLNGAGFAHYELGEFDKAAQYCREATRLAPEYGLAYFNLGLALIESGRLKAACGALGKATQLIAAALCHNALGRALLLRGLHQEALQEFDRATAMDPDSESAHNNRGLALQRLGDLQGAILAFEQALKINPGYLDAWLNLAVLYEQTNRLDEAEATVHRGLAALPGEPALQLVTVRLRRRKGDPDGALQLLEQLPVPDLSAKLARRALYERGRLANLLGREEEAFQSITQANAITRESPAGLYFLNNNYAQEVAALAGWLTGNWADNWQPVEFSSADAPVFLLGFPRSGTTLLEQILAGHPDVVAMEEQSLIGQVGQRLMSNEGSYPASLGSLPAAQRQQLREEYLELARARVGVRPGQLLLDKFPLNTIHLPLIHCLFPDARLVLALRHPCDVALSCFMQDFELNEAMISFTSLHDTAQLYDAVMSIYYSTREQLPLQVHEIRYENLVDNMEEEVRALLAYMGLEWNSAVLDFVATAADKTRIQTPSYEQVSQPLYREARLRWQRYRPQLEEIEPLLRPHCDRLSYSL